MPNSITTIIPNCTRLPPPVSLLCSAQEYKEISEKIIDRVFDNFIWSPLDAENNWFLALLPYHWLIKLSYVYLRIKYPQKGKIEKSIQTTFTIFCFCYMFCYYISLFFVLNICYSTRCFINFFLKKMFIHKHCNFTFLKRLPHSMSVTAYGVS